MQRKKKMRKKIYSEQLLSVQKEKESQYPAQEIYVTGYVIELKKDCYFAGWQDGKILCRSYSYARDFGSVKSAEAYVKEPGLCRFKMLYLQGVLGTGDSGNGVFHGRKH